MEMTRTAICKKSKKGNLYLAFEKEGEKNTLVSLIKDNKAYRPKLKEGNQYDITFTSYNDDTEKGIIALFGVSGI